MNPIDKLAWIEIKDDAILLTKSYGKDKFYIPGGKREMDEPMRMHWLEKFMKSLA